MTDLKPCPFCGSEAEAVHEINGFWSVECVKCGALVDGIAAWNTRAGKKPTDAVREFAERYEKRIAELEKQIEEKGKGNEE